MEYMTLGKPVVATNSGGTKEIVLDKQTAYLVLPKSPEILAHKIKYLLDNPDISTKMGEAGRRRLAEDFSLDKFVEKFVELYKVVLRDKK